MHGNDKFQIQANSYFWKEKDMNKIGEEAK